MIIAETGALPDPALTRNSSYSPSSRGSASGFQPQAEQRLEVELRLMGQGRDALRLIIGGLVHLLRHHKEVQVLIDAA